MEAENLLGLSSRLGRTALRCIDTMLAHDGRGLILCRGTSLARAEPPRAPFAQGFGPTDREDSGCARGLCGASCGELRATAWPQCEKASWPCTCTHAMVKNQEKTESSTTHLPRAPPHSRDVAQRHAAQPCSPRGPCKYARSLEPTFLPSQPAPSVCPHTGLARGSSVCDMRPFPATTSRREAHHARSDAFSSPRRVAHALAYHRVPARSRWVTGSQVTAHKKHRPRCGCSVWGVLSICE